MSGVTRLRLLHLIYDIGVICQKKIKHTFYVLYSDTTWVFDQSKLVQGPICIIYLNVVFSCKKNILGQDCHN